MFLFKGVQTIGFLNTTYVVSEGDSVALVQVGILDGSLDAEVTLSLSTMDSSAQGIIIKWMT